MGLYWFETFYRIGSYIFGGGQVVLPLIVEQVVQYKDECSMVLEKEICTRRPDYEVYPEGDDRIQSWMTEAQFLAGLGIAQVLPPRGNAPLTHNSRQARRRGKGRQSVAQTQWYKVNIRQVLSEPPGAWQGSLRLGSLEQDSQQQAPHSLSSDSLYTSLSQYVGLTFFNWARFSGVRLSEAGFIRGEAG